jgi:hypothetical protein
MPFASFLTKVLIIPSTDTTIRRNTGRRCSLVFCGYDSVDPLRSSTRRASCSFFQTRSPVRATRVLPRHGYSVHIYLPRTSDRADLVGRTAHMQGGDEIPKSHSLAETLQIFGPQSLFQFDTRRQTEIRTTLNFPTREKSNSTHPA